MEIICPEIALKQPKADPRTVLLPNRNFLESSSDHIPDFYLNSKSIANCDKFKKNISNYTTTATEATTTKAVSSSSKPKSVTASVLMSADTLTSSLPSSLFTAFLASNLVNFSKSCHFKNTSFNYALNKNTQKTKLIFFLLFIWCAILLQTTQAVPVRRVSTSGRKLILHTNVYRERYHQKLLEEHRQQQLKIQQQLQEQQQQQRQLQQLQQVQQQLHQLQTRPHHQHLQQQQQQTLSQQQHQVQKNHIFSPIHQTRRHLQQQPHHHHHLHQRAVPRKMSSCENNEIYEHLHRQVNVSLSSIKQVIKNYLISRGNQTFEDMSETWKLINLQTRIPNQQPVSFDNEMHREIHKFYLNLSTFAKLLDYAREDTIYNKTRIEHAEDLEINENIIKFFNEAEKEVNFTLSEAGSLMDKLNIEKPDLKQTDMDFDRSLTRRTRDFLIFKNLVEEFERVLELMENYCKNNAE